MKKISILIIILLLAGCTASKPKTEENNVVVDTAQTNTASDNLIVDTQQVPEGDVTAEMQQFKDAVDEAMKEHFEDYESYYDSNGALNLDIAVEGLVDEVIHAMEGEQEYIDDWNNMVDSLISSSNSLVESAKQSNIENPVVIINLLNDANRNNLLFSVKNGVVDYDAVRDSQ